MNMSFRDLRSRALVPHAGAFYLLSYSSLYVTSPLPINHPRSEEFEWVAHVHGSSTTLETGNSRPC